jgi:hypothetical protein
MVFFLYNAFISRTSAAFNPCWELKSTLLSKKPSGSSKSDTALLDQNTEHEANCANHFPGNDGVYTSIALFFLQIQEMGFLSF